MDYQLLIHESNTIISTFEIRIQLKIRLNNMKKFLIISLFVFCAQLGKAQIFEKITFQTSYCFGTCPVYHLELSAEKTFKLHAETVFLENSQTRELDSSKMGYFTGKIDQKMYNKFITAFQQSDMCNLTFDGVKCCDGSLITMIVNYDGIQKELVSMFPPQCAQALIQVLYEICRTSSEKQTIK